MSAQLTHQGIRPTTTQPAATAGHGPLRGAWHQLRLAIQEINYASHRMVEVQAPWIADKQWYSK
jgi:hypothetical protein